ncbi:hypothetical protein FKZ69_10585 [Pseudomonas azotoformans]|nr:hypothetical protein FKZ69_10585 [Pseudomonas azotoformans]
MAVALGRRFRVNEHRLLPTSQSEKSPSVIVAINRQRTLDSHPPLYFLMIYKYGNTFIYGINTTFYKGLALQLHCSPRNCLPSNSHSTNHQSDNSSIFQQ